MPSLDKGNTNINRPGIFVMNEVFYLPKLAHSNMLVKTVVGGWEANSIFTVAHGSSLTVFSGGAANANELIGTGYNGNSRPLTTGLNCNSG